MTAAGLAAATLPVGLVVGYVTQLTSLVVLLAAMLTVERRISR